MGPCTHLARSPFGPHAPTWHGGQRGSPTSGDGLWTAGSPNSGDGLPSRLGGPAPSRKAVARALPSRGARRAEGRGAPGPENGTPALPGRGGMPEPGGGCRAREGTLHARDHRARCVHGARRVTTAHHRRWGTPAVHTPPGAGGYFSRMYSPGASAMGECLPLPMGGGLRRWPPWALAQVIQSSHQEPACSVAPASHTWGSGGFSSLVQCLALGLGGLTIPAMWPEELSTNRVSPLTSWVVL